MNKSERGSNVELLHEKWFSDPEYRTSYDNLGPEFEIARAVILARKNAGLTQQQLAQRMNTTQSAVARLEGGHSCPSTSTLMRLALATGTRLKISFEAAPRRVTGAQRRCAEARRGIGHSPLVRASDRQRITNAAAERR